MSNETPENHLHDSGEPAGAVALSAAESPKITADADASTAANDDGVNSTNDNNIVNDGCDSSSSSSLVAKGLSSLLASVIRDFDSRAEDTVRSQDQLAFALDRLTRELDQLLEDAPLPFIMQHAVKISGVRKRVSSLNTLLKSIQRRLDNIDRTVSVGVLHENAATESARQR